MNRSFLGIKSGPSETSQQDEEEQPKPKPVEDAPDAAASASQQLEIMGSVATYVTCSVSMVLLNKLVTSPARHGYNYPMMLVFFQNLAATVAVVLAKLVGFVDYPGLSLTFVKRWAPLTAIFTGMLVSSLLSLRTMSVAVVTLIKAFAIICTALGDHLLFGHPLTGTMVAAFVLMYAGSCLGGGTDAWVTTEGLFFSMLNVACTSGYQLYMKGLVDDVKRELGRWGPVFYNNLLSLPLLLGPTIMTFGGEHGWYAAFLRADWWAQMWIGVMCVLSPFMTMSTFWCISATSPTTYAVVGGMNKIPLSLLGMVLFNQWPNVAGFIGITIGLSGGFLYTFAIGRARRDSAVTRAFLAKVAVGLLFCTVAFFWAMNRLGAAAKGPDIRELLQKWFPSSFAPVKAS